MMKDRTERLLCIILGCGAIISSLVGLLSSNAYAPFSVNNVYGQQVELFGEGIYKYNSVLTVASRLGADWIGILGAVILIILCFYKRQRMWTNVLKTAQSTAFIYYFACLTFSISMNSLYLLYVFCFGLSIFLSVHLLSKHFKQLTLNEGVKERKNAGLSMCLFISGGVTMLIWLLLIIPHLIVQSYGELIGVLTTEVTYAIDLGVLCPVMILCSIWIRKKRDIGYKLAPILLYILFSVGPMVILQNLYCIKFGIEIQIPVFVGTVLSFVIMGTAAIIYLNKAIGLLNSK